MAEIYFPVSQTQHTVECPEYNACQVAHAHTFSIYPSSKFCEELVSSNAVSGQTNINVKLSGSELVCAAATQGS